jgi:hypothetical protein
MYAALFQHSDRLTIVERYSRSGDGKTLWMTATFTDPITLREPLVLKRLWRWAPESTITPYDQCEIPTEIKRRTR